MKRNRVIYSLSVEDILDVIEENKMDINLDEEGVKFIEEKVGDIIDWRGAIEFALFKYKREYGNE
ncbi:MAG: hypothetical protein AB1630_09090 [bacterium]